MGYVASFAAQPCRAVALLLPFALMLVAGVPTVAGAQTKRPPQPIGDWIVLREASYQEAFTKNATGSMAGIWCSLESEECFAYLKTERTCEDGTTVPLLGNSAIGAVATESTCVRIKLDEKAALNFARVDDLEVFRSMAESGGEFAFAMPLAGGQFAVLRFSGRGAAEAIKQARTPPPASIREKTRGPRDQVL